MILWFVKIDESLEIILLLYWTHFYKQAYRNTLYDSFERFVS